MDGTDLEVGVREDHELGVLRDDGIAIDSFNPFFPVGFAVFAIHIHSPL